MFGLAIVAVGLLFLAFSLTYKCVMARKQRRREAAEVRLLVCCTWIHQQSACVANIASAALHWCCKPRVCFAGRPSSRLRPWTMRYPSAQVAAARQAELTAQHEVRQWYSYRVSALPLGNTMA